MNRLRRLLEVSQRESGLGLVELLVAMFITALALSMVAAFFTNIARSTVNGRGDRQATGAASVALDEISRVIRVAADIKQVSTPLPAVDTTSGATAITVYAWSDVDPASPVPSKVQFSVDASSNLIERRTTGVLVSGYWSFTGGTTVTRTFSGPLSLGLAYYADAADPNTAPTQVMPTTAAAALSVTSVAVTITAPRKAWQSTAPVVVATTVLMPNTQIS